MKSMFNTMRLPRWQLLSLFVSALLLVACADQSGVGGGAGDQVLQSPNDNRAYRMIELDNGLRALLVSDPDADKAAAALDVYVGSANNDPDRGGLAHFLEHMLFLGTDKYPDPADYEEFITEHGGHRNAYTAFEHTNYFFDVDHAYLAPSLDRFARFFVAPRFNADYVDREINSVEAEYQMGLKTDARRNLDVTREVVNPDHPFSILGVGTRETLADRPGSSVRDELLAFYRKYYSANLMTLAVLGRESLDELQALVEEGFAGVPNHDVAIADIQAPLYPEGSLPMQVNIRPEASERELQLSFPMPQDYTKEYRRKSLEYIGFLVGHEGEGSLLSLLKAQGWAEALAAGGGFSWRGGSAFYISITLTESGMQQREQVLVKVFEYLRLLREGGAVDWLYQEQSRVAALQFRFKEKGRPMGYVSSLAHDMHYYPTADTLRGKYAMEDFTPAEINSILQDYLVAENVVISVIGKDVAVDRESQFYGTPYSVRSLAADEGSWRRLSDAAPDPRLKLPRPNSFIAANVELKSIAENNPAVPALETDSANLRLWYRQDDEFRIPKGAIYASFRTPLGNRSARDAASTLLYVSLLSDAVNEYTYPALLAGLNFSIYNHSRGISLKISGYDDKQLVLLRDIVTKIGEAELDTPRFANIQADLVRSLENVNTSRPFSQVIADTRRLLQHGEWSEEQLLSPLRELTPGDIIDFANAFWGSAQADVLINGNYDASVVAQVSEALEPLLPNANPGPLPEMRVVKLDPEQQLVYPAPVDHDDSVLFLYRQAPADDWHNRAMAALTGQVFKSGFYHQLRTEQQLGYVVSAFYFPVLDVPGVGMVVQSPTTSAAGVNQAMQVFLQGVGTVEGMTLEQFQRHHTALLSELRMPHKNLWEESEYFWREISRGQAAFDSREQLAAAVEAVDYAQWRSWYRTVMLEQPASVAVVAPGRWETLPSGQEVDSAAALQENEAYYSIP
jgi:secreted Zn-dependent insulinase-like peptidase